MFSLLLFVSAYLHRRDARHAPHLTTSPSPSRSHFSSNCSSTEPTKKQGHPSPSHLALPDKEVFIRLVTEKEDLQAHTMQQSAGAAQRKGHMRASATKVLAFSAMALVIAARTAMAASPECEPLDLTKYNLTDYIRWSTTSDRL